MHLMHLMVLIRDNLKVELRTLSALGPVWSPRFSVCGSTSVKCIALFHILQARCHHWAALPFSRAEEVSAHAMD
jgi:hypothetical protein